MINFIHIVFLPEIKNIKTKFSIYCQCARDRVGRKYVVL